MSNAFSALIWWVVPAIGLIGALGYVTWVSKFEGKYQQETQRSVGQFQRFQDSLRDSQARDEAAGDEIEGVTGETSVTQGEINLNSAPPVQKPSRISVIRPDAN
jgi:glutamine synthetase